MMARDTSASPRHPGRQSLMWIVKIAISAGLLYALFTRMDVAHLWQLIRAASVPWTVFALALYLFVLLVSTWRWRLFLAAQHVQVPFRTLTNSYLVATFANNFLPSNIGGDVVRIRDTARAAGSKTLATAVVLADRGVGILGLAIVAACGSTLAARRSAALGPLGPSLLWSGLFAALAVCVFVLAWPDRFAALARPLRVFHADWVDQRIALITGALRRFRQSPSAMVSGLLSSIVVQATLVAFYAAVAVAIHLSVPIQHLAILIPVASIVQMVPLSVNGLGVREATFGVYLSSIGVPLESAIALSFLGAALVMLFSMSGAAAYLARRQAIAAEVASDGM